MASDSDEGRECLIKDVWPSLRTRIVVERVLDQLHTIEDDQKEQIRQKARSAGDLEAADHLISAVLKRPHARGWFQAFVDALIHSGCEYAADFIQPDNPVDPVVEAENDYCVKLIRILYPSLLQMKTEVVNVRCFAEVLINQDDFEKIKTITANEGNIGGARELLRSIVRGRPGWFSQFREILHVTEHKDLYELTGGSDCDKTMDKTVGKLLSLKDEPMESEAAAGSQDSPEFMVISSTNEPPEEQDLYQGVSAKSRQLPDSVEPSTSDPVEAAGGPEKDDIVLRDYQMNVAGPALEGKNIIICLPTGSGKTRVAVYITKKHLDHRRKEGCSGKVIILVNKVPLVEQHFNAEFQPFLKHTYKVERVSGDSQLKISFTEIVKNNDVIVCTAQILENYLERANTGEDEGVDLSDLTLIVIDECHHTQKGGVYNHIMMRYLKQKHKNIRLKKEQKKTMPLPQILGLTASPGVGGATKMEKAEDHILRICANLDASEIMTTDLGQFKREPRKSIQTVEDRKEDPFGDVIKNIMNDIHTHAELNPTSDLGSQTYEQWVVQKERIAATEENPKVRVCAEHLKQYSEGLNLCNTIRMRDALNFLTEYQEEEKKKKKSPDAELVIKITETEQFLFDLFEGKKEKLKQLSEKPEFENDSLSKLRGKVLHEFTSREKARGIIFTKTRRSAIALSQWIQENPKFADVGVKAYHVIGAGDQSVVKPMTSAEQRDVLTKFRDGEVNLLIATTVAEEGLDIAACNFVIRYGLVTNEIAMIQARGRGRAEDSSYTLVDVKNSGVAEKECVNEYRITMMNKAINKIRTLKQEDYDRRILEYQMQAIMEGRMRMKKKQQQQMQTEKGEVKFSCRSCSKHVCTGEDIQMVDVHRVNVSLEFKKLFIKRENTTLQERHFDSETEANEYIACRDCGQRWGSMMLYRGIDCPSLHVKNFVVTFNGKKKTKCTSWSDLKIKFPDFQYIEYVHQLGENSDEDD